MNIEEFRMVCLKLKAVEETFPFDETTLVFKVMGKMFAAFSLDADPPRVNLKALPERSIEWREEFHQIIPGWHMNKKHWNSVYIEDGLDDKFIIEMVQHSYDLVVSKLTKKLQKELAELDE